MFGYLQMFRNLCDVLSFCTYLHILFFETFFIFRNILFSALFSFSKKYHFSVFLHHKNIFSECFIRNVFHFLEHFIFRNVFYFSKRFSFSKRFHFQNVFNSLDWSIICWTCLINLLDCSMNLISPRNLLIG